MALFEYVEYIYIYIKIIYIFIYNISYYDFACIIATNKEVCEKYLPMFEAFLKDRPFVSGPVSLYWLEVND